MNLSLGKMVGFEKVYLITTNKGEIVLTYELGNQYLPPYSVIEIVSGVDGEVASIVGTLYDSSGNSTTQTYNVPNFYKLLMVHGDTVLAKLQSIYLNLGAEQRAEIDEISVGPTDLQRFVNFFATHVGSTLFLYSLLSRSNLIFRPLISHLGVEDNLNDLINSRRKLIMYYENIVFVMDPNNPNTKVVKAWFEAHDKFWDYFGKYLPEGSTGGESETSEIIYRSTLASALITQSYLQEVKNNLAAINSVKDEINVKTINLFNMMKEQFGESVRQSELRVNKNTGQVLSLVAKTVSYAITSLNDTRNEVISDINSAATETMSGVEDKKDNIERNISITMDAAKDEIAKLNNEIGRWNSETKRRLDVLASDIEKKTVEYGLTAANSVYKEVKSAIKDGERSKNNGEDRERKDKEKRRR